ncbi:MULTISPECIES: hypothetical protein [unclassified Psychrobacillus]|uniref:hypothetical protein n=1 Tax=unclassified Psychrobacillus TaxID=2636677 RepID=UPI0030FD062C
MMKTIADLMSKHWQTLSSESRIGGFDRPSFTCPESGRVVEYTQNTANLLDLAGEVSLPKECFKEKRKMDDRQQKGNPYFSGHQYLHRRTHRMFCHTFA